MPREIVILDCLLECIEKGPPDFPEALICFVDNDKNIIEMKYQHGNKKNTKMTQLEAAKVWLAWDHKKNRVPDFETMSDRDIKVHLTGVRQRFRQALKSLIQRGILFQIPTNDRHVERFRIATNEETNEHRKRTKAERKTKYQRSPSSSSSSSSSSDMSDPGSPNDRLQEVPSLPSSPSPSSSSSSPPPPGSPNEGNAMHQTLEISFPDLENFVVCVNPDTGMKLYVDAEYLKGYVPADLLPPSFSDLTVRVTDDKSGAGCPKTQNNILYAEEPVNHDTSGNHRSQEVLPEDSLGSINGTLEDNFMSFMLDGDSQWSLNNGVLRSTEDPLWAPTVSFGNELGMCHSSSESVPITGDFHDLEPMQ